MLCYTKLFTKVEVLKSPKHINLFKLPTNEVEVNLFIYLFIYPRASVIIGKKILAYFDTWSPQGVQGQDTSIK